MYKENHSKDYYYKVIKFLPAHVRSNFLKIALSNNVNSK